MKKILAVFAAFALVLGFGLAIAAPAVAAPTDCTGPVFCAYQNTAPPYGSQVTIAVTAPRNTCIDTVGAKTYQYNNTGLVWRAFRGSDPTCQGAHIALPGNSHGPISAWGSGWSSFGAVSRTSTVS